MDPAEFEQLVVEVLDSLPPLFAHCLQDVEVIIEPRASREVKQRLGMKPGHTLFGLYEGVPRTERSVHGTYLPDRITIFREPLVSRYASPERLRKQVRRTVLHELAHHMGISDERLRELGAY